MFKRLSALVRGTVWNAAEDVTDRNAIIVLDQQIRDCAQALTQARKAVALAEAEFRQEAKQHNHIKTRLEDLESRTVAAMHAGKGELAREAAEMIAALEADSKASEETQARFEREILRLRASVKDASARLSALKRGRQVSAAAARVRHLRAGEGNGGKSALRDAEETLQRLKVRQTQADLVEASLESMDREASPDHMVEKLAGAGCGAPVNTTADKVLARLAARQASATTSSTQPST
ncbi:PspA/IM30 family protein [Hoeflea sp.]|uniref:PspA/IM30 family protein n=1 Tax=Hoeflea sp. TaxID=1940281 RepID=UPI00374930B3